MRDQIKKYLATRDDVSFPELMDQVPEAAGDRTMFHNNNSVVLWEGVSQLFAETIESLLADGSVVLRLVSHETILGVHAFGGHPILNHLPIAKRVQNYTKPHWLPTVICDGKRSVSKK